MMCPKGGGLPKAKINPNKPIPLVMLCAGCKKPLVTISIESGAMVREIKAECTCGHRTAFKVQ